MERISINFKNLTLSPSQQRWVRACSTADRSVRDLISIRRSWPGHVHRLVRIKRATCSDGTFLRRGQSVNQWSIVLLVVLLLHIVSRVTVCEVSGIMSVMRGAVLKVANRSVDLQGWSYKSYWIKSKGTYARRKKSLKTEKKTSVMCFFYVCG